MRGHIKNVRNWIKDHKKEIGIITVTSVVSAAGGIILYKKFGHIDVACDWKPSEFTFDTGVYDGSNNLYRYHDGAAEIFMYEDIPLSAMGKLGEYLIEQIPDLPDNRTVSYLELAIVED